MDEKETENQGSGFGLDLLLWWRWRRAASVGSMIHHPWERLGMCPPTTTLPRIVCPLVAILHVDVTVGFVHNFSAERSPPASSTLPEFVRVWLLVFRFGFLKSGSPRTSSSMGEGVHLSTTGSPGGLGALLRLRFPTRLPDLDMILLRMERVRGMVGGGGWSGERHHTFASLGQSVTRG